MSSGPGTDAVNAVDEVAPHEFGFDLGANHTVIRHLHRGADTDVYETWSLDRLCNCVVKVLRPAKVGHPRSEERVALEGERLRALSHPHIVRCYGSIPGDVPAIVLERVRGTTAHLVVHGLGTLVPWTDIITWGVQLGGALHHMHGMGFLHLDLKPGNVMIDQQHATLIDLHVARPPGPCPAGMGSRGYASPEQLRGEDVGPAADVWGLGMVLYELATGRPAYDVAGMETFTPDDDWVAPQLERRPAATATYRSLPARLGDLIDASLELDPANRPDLITVISTLLS